MSWTSKRKYMINKGKICKYPGCKRIAKTKGYCLSHYNSSNEKEVNRSKRNVEHSI